ncbi:hypothetical protein NKI54_15720 [Mesorhizobium sp. M0663]|uniref:hypothetical protein n=1 Tax=Mesorhizobium sp. M0663 TaxID=2956981 RepID=UPI0033384476
MSVFMRIALITDLVVVLIEKAKPGWASVLPFAGDHFAQLTILMLLAVIAEEVADLFSKRPHRAKKTSAQKAPDAVFLTCLSKADIAGVTSEAGCPKDAAKAVERAPKPDGILQAEKELGARAGSPPRYECRSARKG